MNDTLEDVDTSFLEEILEVPHCKTRHENKNVRLWAGECTHEVVAMLSYCRGEGGVCRNTVEGMTKISPHRTCVDCGNSIGECWKVYPL